MTTTMACGPKEDCYPGFEAGEQFRITVTGMRNPSDIPCQSAPLNPGDSVTLTAADEIYSQPNGCYTRLSTGVVPEFAKSLVTECMPGSFQLGVECRGTMPDGCEVWLGLSVGGGRIDRETKLVEDGALTVTWAGNCGLHWSCGSNVFAARIERLPPT